MAGFEFLGKLIASVDRRVHRSAKPLLGFRERRRKIRQPQATNDHEVQVAFGALITTGYGTVDKGYDHFRTEGFKGLAENIHNAYCLCDKSRELRKKGTTRVGLKVDAVSVSPLPENAGLREGG